MENNEELDKALSGYNVFIDTPDIIVFKNPVLNAMFNGDKDTGGLPKGSVIQIAAQSGTGKSTLAISVAKELCEQDKTVLYIDAEKGLNMNMLSSTGIDKYLKSKNNPKGNFIIVRSCDCSEINTIIQKVCETNSVDLIILDSLGSLDSGIYDLGGTDANNPKVGADSKSIKIVMKTINKMALTHNVSFICINHVAQTIGTYIPQENPVGGRAPIYLSDIIIKLTKKSSDFEKMNLGQKVEYEAIKSRYGRGKCKIPFYIAFGKGIAMLPTYREVLDKIQENGKPILEVRGGGNGSLYLNGEEYKYRGENQLLKLICDHYSKIKSLIDWKMFLPEKPKVPDYLMDPEDNIDLSDLPKELTKLQIVETSNDNYYFDKGVDSTGQKYSIYYNKATEKIGIEYDSSGKEKQYSSIKDYKDYKKELDKYLKSL